MRFLLLLMPLLLASCATVDPVSSQLGNQGEEVNNVCFVRQIKNPTPQGESAFVFSHDNDDYLVTLIGQCPALQQADSIAYVVSRRTAASRCLNPGDSLRFGAQDEQPSYCTVNRLFRWTDDQ